MRKGHTWRTSILGNMEVSYVSAVTREKILSFEHIEIPPQHASCTRIEDAVVNPMKSVLKQKILTEIS